MKALIYLFALTIMSCGATKNMDNNSTENDNSSNKMQEEITMITFDSGTRGSQENMTVSPTEYNYLQNGFVQKKESGAVSKEDWTKFMTLLSEINLTTINELRVPSTKHQMDGAMGSSITIKTTSGEYRSKTFDNKNAPEPLQPLVDQMFGLKGMKTK